MMDLRWRMMDLRMEQLTREEQARMLREIGFHASSTWKRESKPCLDCGKQLDIDEGDCVCMENGCIEPGYEDCICHECWRQMTHSAPMKLPYCTTV